MDERGFIVSLDAVLGLLVILIIIGTLSFHSNPISNPAYTENKIMAQDIMEIMAILEPYPGEGSLLEKMAGIMDEGNCSQTSQNQAGLLATIFLDKNYPDINYNLTEINHLKGNTLCANAPMQDAANINSAQRNWKGYTFQLYVWY
ncbi:MAG: hypothetical protein CIT03_07005 [Methanobacterium sp.]|nr:MAG: hypothetical protein CIT03_07005 [Methanobacterium sp.]